MSYPYPPPGNYFNPYQQGNPYQQMMDRLKELEDKQHAYQQSRQIPHVLNPNFVPQTSFVIVKSEDEAWKHPPAWDGSKQYFYDDVNDSFYVKYMDAAVPQTFKAVYKRIATEEPAAPIQAENSNDIAEALNGLCERLTALEGLSERLDVIDDMFAKIDLLRKSMKSIEEMMLDGAGITAEDMAVHGPKDTGRATNNAKSAGAGATATVSSGSNANARGGSTGTGKVSPARK